MRAARYSGSGRTGICVCGHSWKKHHLGMVVRSEMLEVDNGGKEAYVPQECEFFGCNESGGLDAEGNVHCFGYRDSALPDEHN